MAITREARRQMEKWNAHRLRSGKNVASPQTTHRRRRPLSVPAPRKTTANNGIVDHKILSSLAPAVVAEQADVENFLTQPCSSTTEAYSANLPMSTTTPLFSPGSHDNLAIGLPADGQWDHDDAFAQRFCFRHGETEYLLSTPDRWMDARDFKRHDAAEHLETHFDQYKQHLNPLGHQDHHAECVGTLWSHIDSVVVKRQIGFRVWYRVHWKRCWTPSSLIDNLSWVESCLQVHEERKRRSTRLKRTADVRARVNEAIMAVARIG